MLQAPPKVTARKNCPIDFSQVGFGQKTETPIKYDLSYSFKTASCAILYGCVCLLEFKIKIKIVKKLNYHSIRLRV